MSSQSPLPPQRPHLLQSLPQLHEGNTVRVETESHSYPNRTLTVISKEPSHSINALEGLTKDGYTLEGYGTTYSLIEEMGVTRSWQRVVLAYPSSECGEIVQSLRVSKT